VRFHFQERPWDLYGAVGYSIVIALTLLAVGVGNLAAIFLVLFTPGYALVAALFPSGKEIDWVERVALSVGLSIAVVPLLGLVLNFTPFGIRFPSVVATVVAFTCLLGLVAYFRRMRLPPTSRLSATFEFHGTSWAQSTTVDKALSIALAASIVAAAGTLAYVLVTPRPGESFTELFILGSNGTASDYPTNLTVSEIGTVVVGVTNHEFARVNYTLRVDLVGVEVVFNSTSGRNMTVERNRTALTWFNFTIDHGGNWTRTYSFSINSTGLWKVQFLLFRDDDFSTAYRTLHMFVRVTP